MNEVASRPTIKITKLAHLKGHKDSIYDFVVDKNATKVYSVGADGYVVEWDYENSADGKLIARVPEALYSVSQIGGQIIVGSRSGKIYSFDLDKKSLASNEQMHQGGIFFIHKRFSGGEDGVLRSPSLKIDLAMDSLRCLLETDDFFYVGCSDNNIYQLEKVSLEVQAVLKGHTNSVFGLAEIDQDTILSTGRDAHIRAWDLKIGQEVFSVPAHMYQATSLDYNGRFVLSSSMDKTIKVWSDDLKLIKVIDLARNESHSNCINKVKWINDEKFVSCSDDRSLILWQIEIKS